MQSHEQICHEKENALIRSRTNYIKLQMHREDREMRSISMIALVLERNLFSRMVKYMRGAREISSEIEN